LFFSPVDIPAFGTKVATNPGFDKSRTAPIFLYPNLMKLTSTYAEMIKTIFSYGFETLSAASLFAAAESDASNVFYFEALGSACAQKWAASVGSFVDKLEGDKLSGKQVWDAAPCSFMRSLSFFGGLDCMDFSLLEALLQENAELFSPFRKDLDNNKELHNTPWLLASTFEALFATLDWQPNTPGSVNWCAIDSWWWSKPQRASQKRAKKKFVKLFKSFRSSNKALPSGASVPLVAVEDAAVNSPSKLAAAYASSVSKIDLASCENKQLSFEDAYSCLTGGRVVSEQKTFDNHEKASAERGKLRARCRNDSILQFPKSVVSKCLLLGAEGIKDLQPGAPTSKNYPSLVLQAYVKILKEEAGIRGLAASSATLAKIAALDFRKVPVRQLLEGRLTQVCGFNDIVDKPGDEEFLVVSFSALNNYLRTLFDLVGLVVGPAWAKTQLGHLLSLFRELSLSCNPVSLGWVLNTVLADFDYRLHDQFIDADSDSPSLPDILGANSSALSAAASLNVRRCLSFSQQAAGEDVSSWFMEEGSLRLAPRWGALPASSIASAAAEHRAREKPTQNTPAPSNDKKKKSKATGNDKPLSAEQAKSDEVKKRFSTHKPGGTLNVHWREVGNGWEYIGLEKACTRNPCRMFDRCGTCNLHHSDHPKVTGTNFSTKLWKDSFQSSSTKKANPQSSQKSS
jgi:hypothetical protein